MTFIGTLCILQICQAQSSLKISTKDFDKASGTWVGTLTYMDYSSGKPYTMPANALIHRIKQTKTYIVSNLYPNEPSANSVDTIIIAQNGQFIGKEEVRSKKKLPNGSIEIISEEKGIDGNDNKAAFFRHTYILGKDILSFKKEVRFDGQTVWIKRHEYTYYKERP